MPMTTAHVPVSTAAAYGALRNRTGLGQLPRPTRRFITVDELVAVIKQPGAIFSATPVRSMLWAEYMHRIGMIKQKPASWKDFTFPFIHDRAGS